MSRYRPSPLSSPLAVSMPTSPAYQRPHTAVSTATAAEAIGALLSSPFDSDGESEDELCTPQQRTHTPITRGVVPYTTPRKDQLLPRVKSLQGIVDVHDEVHVPAYPSPNHERLNHASPTLGTPAENALAASPRLETPTYPSPTRPGLREQRISPQRPARPARPQIITTPPTRAQQRNAAPASGTAHAQAPALQAPVLVPTPTAVFSLSEPPSMSTPFQLPAPCSPISSYLASPPAAHVHPASPTSVPFSPPFSPPGSSFFPPPASPFARGARSSSVSSTSESIRGYDALVEKHALFRGGEEELAPRPAGTARVRVGRTAGREGGAAPKSGMDFWKRMSLVVRLDDMAESEWLAEDQRRKRMVKRGILVTLMLVFVIAAIVVVAVVVRDRIPA